MLGKTFKGQDNETRKQNMRESIEGLAEAVLQPGAGDEVFAEFLRLDRLLWRYSFGNQALIAMQRPNTRRVASLKRFDRLAREKGHEAVKWGNEKYTEAVVPQKGTQAIWIWVPCPYRKEEAQADGTTTEVRGVFFKPGPVWAIEDLQFKATRVPCIDDPDFLPDFVPNHGERAGEYHATLKQWAEGEGITVEEGYTGDAAGVSFGGRIVERIGDPVGKRFGVLVHEVAHELLHKDDKADLPRRIKEAEAEAVAMVVCEYLGFAQAEHSAAYLRNHGATKQDVLDSMKRIFDVSATLIDVIDKGDAEEAEEAEEEREAVEVNG